MHDLLFLWMPLIQPLVQLLHVLIDALLSRHVHGRLRFLFLRMVEHFGKWPRLGGVAQTHILVQIIFSNKNSLVGLTDFDRCTLVCSVPLLGIFDRVQ